MWRSICGICFSLCITAITFVNAYALDKNPSTQFRSYRSIEINDHPLLVDPKLQYRMIKNEPIYEKDFGPMFGEELIQIECGKYSINIGYSDGHSGDPNYEIVATIGKHKFMRNIVADNLAVSSTCMFYAGGETDKTFDMRQKFIITAKGIEETVQAFYLVDKACKTSAATILTSEQCGKGSVVAHLPKGAEVRVLLSEWYKTDEFGTKEANCSDRNDSYLVSTPFGLVGWVQTTRGSIGYKPGVPLGCIIFNGD